MRKKSLNVSETKTGRTLSRVLILLFSIQIFIALTIISLISYLNSVRTIDEFAFQIVDETAREVQQELDYFLDTAELINNINVDSTRIGTLDLEDKSSLENNFYNQIDLFEYVSLLCVGTEDGEYLEVQRSDENGEYIYAAAGEETNYNLQLWKSDENQNHFEMIQEVENYDPRQRPWYRSAVEGQGSSLSPIYAYASTGEFTISANQAFYAEDGTLSGVYSANLTLEHFEKFLSTLLIGKTGQTFIVEENGFMVASSELTPLAVLENDSYKRLEAVNSEDRIISEAMKHYLEHYAEYSELDNGYKEKIKLDQELYYLEFLPFSIREDLNWVIFVVIPQSDFMGQIQKNLFQTLILIIGALMFSIFVGIITAQWAARPISNLNSAARSIAQGKWIKPIRVERDDEIGELTRSFNQMAAQLQDSFSSLENQIETQKKIEEALRESEEKFRLIIENANEGVVLFDRSGKIIEINQSASGFAKISREGILNKNVSDLFGELVFDVESAYEALQECINGNPIIGMQMKIARKDGIEKVVRGNLMPVRKNEEIIGVSMVLEDITNSIKATEEMIYLRRLLSNILDSMPSFMIGINEKRQVTHWNRQTQKYTGLGDAEVLGKDLKDVYPQLFDRVPLLEQKLQQQKLYKYSKVTWEDEEDVHYVDITLYPLLDEGYCGAVIRLDDVTEQVQTEELLIQSEKMMSVGGLAAGMAHEINNPLAGIMQNTQVIQNRLSLSLPKNQKVAEEIGTDMETIQAYIRNRGIEKMIENISESGQRAARIVENMLDFSRKSTSLYIPHDLRDLIDKTLELAANDYDLKKKFDFRNIKIIKEFDPELPDVYCDRSKIQQVIFNIIKNGAQAMSENKANGVQSRLILRLKKSGKMVVIEIEDNGPGMDEDVRKRVFEPFFTTKEVGRGTGLGLSISYFIITKHHGGKMAVESTIGKGTRFVISLPIKNYMERE